MPSTEFLVCSALQRRARTARRPIATDVVSTHARRTYDVSTFTPDTATNVSRADRTALLAAIAACDPAPLIAGETDFNADAPHATPELVRGLSVVPNVPTPTVTEDTWETTYRLQTFAGSTHARRIGDRDTLRGMAPTFEGRTAETPTVLARYADGDARTLPVARYDRKESIHLRAIHENARLDNTRDNYKTGRELTMREALRLRTLNAAGSALGVD